MIRNWYNQIPYPALKTKREITKYINWRQFTKGTRGKQNEQIKLQIDRLQSERTINRVSSSFPKSGHSATLT